MQPSITTLQEWVLDQFHFHTENVKDKIKCKRRNKRSSERKKRKEKNNLPIEVNSLGKVVPTIQKLFPFILSDLHICFSELSFEREQL